MWEIHSEDGHKKTNDEVIIAVYQNLRDVLGHQRRIARARIAPNYCLVIHMPKCGGTALREAVRSARLANIEVTDHVRLNEHWTQQGRLRRSPSVTAGLIREPLTWLRSYTAFRAEKLRTGLQSPTNFPYDHPISILINGSTSSLATATTNQNDPDFLLRAEQKFPQVTLYGRQIESPFGFMRKTGSGFWTWSILYHYGSQTMNALDSPAQVESQVRQIRDSVLLLRQECLAQDAERTLGIPRQSFSRLRVSQSTEEDLQPLVPNTMDAWAYATLSNVM